MATHNKDKPNQMSPNSAKNEPASDPDLHRDDPAQPLDRAALTDVVDLALWAGQLLIENGAESQRVEETVRMLGIGLGCDWGSVLVSHNAIMTTHISGGEFRTKIRQVTQGAVNMSLIEAISHLTHRIEEGKYDRLKVRAELERISQMPRPYNRLVTVLAVGLACAAFSRLFGGDWLIFAVTWTSASVAMFVRQELARWHFNPLLAVIITAFVAGGLVGLFNMVLEFDQLAEPVLAASVLLLVPGVPFINSVEDLIKGYTVIGLARGATAGLIILAIALGLLLAMQLTGVRLL
jgi:uncharacterized membrane protein YjjP (DUF1212 family)